MTAFQWIFLLIIELFVPAISALVLSVAVLPDVSQNVFITTDELKAALDCSMVVLAEDKEYRRPFAIDAYTEAITEIKEFKTVYEKYKKKQGNDMVLQIFYPIALMLLAQPIIFAIISTKWLKIVLSLAFIIPYFLVRKILSSHTPSFIEDYTPMKIDSDDYSLPYISKYSSAEEVHAYFYTLRYNYLSSLNNKRGFLERRMKAAAFCRFLVYVVVVPVALSHVYSQR